MIGRRARSARERSAPSRSRSARSPSDARYRGGAGGDSASRRRLTTSSVERDGSKLRLIGEVSRRHRFTTSVSRPGALQRRTQASSLECTASSQQVAFAADAPALTHGTRTAGSSSGFGPQIVPDAGQLATTRPISASTRSIRLRAISGHSRPTGCRPTTRSSLPCPATNRTKWSENRRR